MIARVQLDPNRRSEFAERIRASSSDDENGCWLWEKSKTRNGYAKFVIASGHHVGGHRVSFFAFTGEIPNDLDVCHTCDVRHCVNPKHFFLGTRSENLMDASRKGRLGYEQPCRGSLHPSAKLNEIDVGEILSAIRRGAQMKSLARQYGVSPGLIAHIKHGRAWTHVSGKATE